jgi:hypothetical protein
MLDQVPGKILTSYRRDLGKLAHAIESIPDARTALRYDLKAIKAKI